MIVDGRASVGSDENIEVEAGHLALPFDRKTIAIVLDRLSWPDGKRAPFDPARFSCGK